MTDENLAPATNDLDFADLDAGHGQPVGQVLCGQVNIDVLFQPA